MGTWGGANHAGRILVVEDDEAVRFGISASLRKVGYDVSEADTCRDATRAVGMRLPDVVITDLRLPDDDAFALLPRLRALSPTLPVYVVSGYGTIDLAVRAVKEGAEDFLTKPIDVTKLLGFVSSAVKRSRLRSPVPRRELAAFVSSSPAVKALEDEVERLRDADCSVLLLGETGTGKSVLARRIHRIGSRGTGPFVDVNCATLSKELVESELFGHERGAFTGAQTRKIGLFEAADGGTLFLDEIGDIDLSVQPKVLKALEEKRFRRLGDIKEHSVDARLIAATHRDLRNAVRDKAFRADLFYRLATVTLTIPPLRERKEDLVPLARSILATLSPEARFTDEGERKLIAYPWPGNIRELRSIVERAVLLSQDGAVRANDLRCDPADVAGHPSLTHSTRSLTMGEVEREHIQRALDLEDGRVEGAALRLGIPRSTLYQKLKAYGLKGGRSRGPRNCP